MNLFFLNIDPEQNSKETCDKHVVKMVLEIVQMLYTAHHLQGTPPKFAYKISHIKHPTSLWIREKYENYSYAVQVAKYLSIEYTYRYNKIHSCQQHIDWLLLNIPKFNKKIEYKEGTWFTYNKYFESIGMTPVPLAMPDECKGADPIQSYRNYYIMKKSYFARWTSRKMPRWYTPFIIRSYFKKLT